MRLGEIRNEAATPYGKPLDGVRVLALEQMQALPWGTQLLARLGADVVKVEHPTAGESGRGSLPAIEDPQGRRVGATFLRNNLNKRSVGIDLKSERGRDLVKRLAPGFDVFAENFKGGTLTRLGLGYDDIAVVHPGVVYLSVSGFGNTLPSPYRDWPAYAAIAEAMSGIYDFKRSGDQPPVAAPVGALGDISTAMFGVIGVLAALRHRDRTGLGQYVDVAMLDAMISMTDIVTQFWSFGLERGNLGPLIMHGFRAADGFFIMQVQREHQFGAMAAAVGHPEWTDDPRFATREGWLEHLEAVIRPGVEGWAADKTSLEVTQMLSAAGVAAGPCFTDEQVVHDPHVAAHGMLVEVPRPDPSEPPLLQPGNPIKLSRMAEGPETRVPWLGEHTNDVLGAELGLTDAELGTLRSEGVIG